MAEHTTQRVTVRGTARSCFAVVTDFESYPQWAADIKAVTVEEADAEGRATRVTWRTAAFGRSTTYTLDYDYSEAPSAVSWKESRGDITSRLDGSYRFEELGGGETEVIYSLDVELRVPIPGFVKRRAESRIVATALREFKARVENGAPAEASEEPTPAS
ncbi:MAG TPA: SRPBCC family protein [Acidimicrobiales bacterium]|nr:SRPBCC family protein [Acidimicrobiales bacterium]